MFSRIRNSAFMSVIAVSMTTSAASASITGNSPAESQSAETEKARPEKAKKICRTIRNTGMRTAARQCKTVAQWESDEERANGDDLQVKVDGVGN